MKSLLPVCAFFLCSLTSCVNGKLNPQVAQVVGVLDTAGCELITVTVKDQEAGDICAAASNFFNNLLANVSAPAAAPKMAEKNPKKYPVKYHGVTVGHFYKPFDAAVQAKIDATPDDKAWDLTQK